MFQFTHPGRGATTKYLNTQSDKVVSIHAPREGCDLRAFDLTSRVQRVSIHAPREGCDCGMKATLIIPHMFQFTHPGRGATASGSSIVLINRFQFTHPGRGATT